MKRFALILALTLAATSISAAPTHVKWEAVGTVDGRFHHRLIVTGNLDFSRLAFNSLSSYGDPLNPTDTLGEIMPGFYYVASPRFRADADSVVITFSARNPLNASRTPDGFHRVNRDGSVSPIIYERARMTSPEQWTTPAGRNPMPKAEDIYAENARLAASQALAPYDVVPSYKSISLTGGDIKLPLTFSTAVIDVPEDKPEFYRITVSPDGILAEAATEKAAGNALAAFSQQVIRPGVGSLPAAVIEDWPDYPYRGLMLDIVRNYQTTQQIEKMLRHMRDLRLNVFHFHFADDEAWRVEMPSLPELTTMSSRRGYTTNDVVDGFLPQLYRGDGNPDSYNTTGNGYFSRQEFIDLLRLADSYGICVIPEVESPGHARAAIRAMERRAITDPSFRLIHDGDTSSYTSAQGYHDCVMNPALESTYRFMGTVFDDIIDMYSEAGVDLPAIHIGGDEVPRGAWSGSEKALKFMETNGIADERGLHAYFVQRIADMLAERGVKMSGWQEISHVQASEKSLADNLFSVNFWSNATPKSIEKTYESAISGCPVIISNVDYLYLDQNFNAHPEECGLPWGGFVDDLRTLHTYPRVIYPADMPVLGLEATLFAETINSPEMQDAYVFPKVYGAAERAWNADSTYTDAEFTALIAERLIPALTRTRTAYHVRQPGIMRASDGLVHINSPYPTSADVEIRYTIDGTEPDVYSPLYSAPIATDAKEVRARLFLLGRPSLTTYFYDDQQ